MQNPPLVSLLMPVRNEASFIERSLGAVLAQDYPRDRIEVIVADGLSTDATREIIEALAEQHPNLGLVDNPGKIVSTGLNAALRVARGEIIIRVDGHTVIAPDYCRQCVEALRQPGVDNVGGRMIAVSDGSFGRAVALATCSRFGIGNARFHYSDREELVDTVYLGASMKRWCVIRMMSSIIACALREERSCSIRELNLIIIIALPHCHYGANIFNMVIGKCVSCKSIRARWRRASLCRHFL